MALIKGFDPSKQFKVVKTFFEGGRKYREGDIYDPNTKIGKSKRLFRHYVARRIVAVEEQSEKAKEVKETAGEDVQESPKNNKETKTTTKNSSSGRGRPKKKSEEE